MGLHLDADEKDRTTALLSFSLGLPARFRLGGPSRKDSTSSYVLEHGDVMVMGGASRNFYHGIDRVMPRGLLDPQGLPFGGRLNLTVRRVTAV